MEFQSRAYKMRTTHSLWQTLSSHRPPPYHIFACHEEGINDLQHKCIPLAAHVYKYSIYVPYVFAQSMRSTSMGWFSCSVILRTQPKHTARGSPHMVLHTEYPSLNGHTTLPRIDKVCKKLRPYGARSFWPKPITAIYGDRENTTDVKMHISITIIITLYILFAYLI